MVKPGIFFIIAIALTCAFSTSAQDRTQLERRLQSVATLIESSSAAKQIEASGEPQALQKRQEARAAQRNAADAFARGDLQAAVKLLDDATRRLLEGARLAAPEQVTGDKRRIDLANRIQSAKALLAAHQRIVKEKAAGPQAEEAGHRIEALLDEAAKQTQANRIDQARASADQAYLLARVSIESLRRGDTLVRSLNFATKREEYDYELDRNETHRMLVKVLLDDKRAGNSALDRSVRGFLDAASTLRLEAERQAALGDHAAAVKTLEDATRELVRAIRNAGVYIPG